jgi:YebC/PmpR family DNA-binding regulatory protein
MSGHSKWATTKHKKAIIDKRRAKVFAKLVKAIEVSARTGGADPSGNPTLYDAIQKARKNSVPSDNIDRAVKRGAGLESGGATYETIIYEGYGPQGVALLIECLSDNRNRAASEVRVAVTRNGGTMADPGSVSYLFNRRGVVIVPKVQPAEKPEARASTDLNEDRIMEAVLDVGAEEINDLGASFEIVSEPSAMVEIRSAIERAGWEYESAEVSLLPSVSISVDKEGAEKLFALIEAIEELDDVQNVYANFDVSDEIMAALS